MQDYRFLYRENPRFEGLDNQFMEQIYLASHFHSFAARDVVFAKDEKAEAACMIISGKFSLRNGHINSPPIQMLAPGDFYGDVPLLIQGQHHATLCAESDGAVLAISHKDFMSLVWNFPGFATRLYEQISRQAGQFHLQTDEIRKQFEAIAY